jgi:replicative DNA helicase
MDLPGVTEHQGSDPVTDINADDDLLAITRYFSDDEPRPTPPTNVVPINGDTDRRRYRRLLQEACDELARTASGRNSRMNELVFDVAKFVNAGHLTRQEVEDAFLAAGRCASALGDHPLTEHEMRATLRSALNGQTESKTLPEYTPQVTVVGADAFAVVNGDGDGDTENGVWGGRRPVTAIVYLSENDNATALWGSGEEVLWAEGEALMIAGGMGLGKTTLAGQVIRAQLGLPPTDVLGLPVAQATGPILYLAMDRPRQIRRSMLRQFDPETEAEQLASLLIRIGPPIADLAVRPTLLVEMAQDCGAAIVYVDSLKDAAIGLSDDKVGAAYNRARQHLLADGRQICELHHNRKSVAGGGKDSSVTVSDVYGSTWLTSGAGSVIMLTGEPGDPIIDFRHIKQPLNEVGPWRLLNNPDAGYMAVDHNVDLLDLVAFQGADGLTAKGAAIALFETEKPRRADVQKARRRLDKLTNQGLLDRHDGGRGGGAHRDESVWFLAQVQSRTPKKG